jgi:hypothetical protein
MWNSIAEVVLGIMSSVKNMNTITTIVTLAEDFVSFRNMTVNANQSFPLGNVTEGEGEYSIVLNVKRIK